jgi:hypothetical protein
LQFDPKRTLNKIVAKKGVVSKENGAIKKKPHILQWDHCWLEGISGINRTPPITGSRV